MGECRGSGSGSRGDRDAFETYPVTYGKLTPVTERYIADARPPSR